MNKCKKTDIAEPKACVEYSLDVLQTEIHLQVLNSIYDSSEQKLEANSTHPNCDRVYAKLTLKYYQFSIFF